MGPFRPVMRCKNRFSVHVWLAVTVSMVAFGCGSGAPARGPIVDVSARQTGSSDRSGAERAGEGDGQDAENDGPGIVGKIFGIDGDEDGIRDDDDKCPSAAEDFDDFEDRDGCPEPDNDGDGVADWDDKCPNVPETINGFADDDGCPDANIDRAKRAFHEGATAFAQGDYVKARKHFEDAYNLEPRDAILYNIAVCAERQGDRKYACQYYRQWRSTPTGSTSPNSVPSLETCP